MPDFRIVQLEIDGEYYFVRCETIGASTIDGENGYRSDHVIAHFKHMYNSKTKLGSKTKPTKMDVRGAHAQVINVTVLHTLLNCDQRRARKVKAEEVERLTRKFPGKVVNVR